MNAIAKRTRNIIFSMIAAALSIGLFAQSANAAATLNVTANPKIAGAPTLLTLNTTLTGIGNAKKQYGARINLPSTLQITRYSAYGSNDDRCDAGAFTDLNNGMTPAAQAFDNSTCPEASRVGTATLGSASGGIYWVDVGPLPELGVYFDTGVSNAFGRRLRISYNGTNAPTLEILGLPKTSTNGLTLTFDNPYRPNNLPKQIWQFAASNVADCLPTSTVTGNVWTWPSFGTTATSVAMAPKTVSIAGCGIGYSLATDTRTAGSMVALTLRTPLNGTGLDTHQYGARFDLPGLLRISFPAYGSPGQECPPTSVSPLDLGITPTWEAFEPYSCPDEAKIGTATLGSATGSIYWIDHSPIPEFGVYFGQGVDEPFGVVMTHTYNGTSAPTLEINGLPNAASTGLQLVFDNPSRPTLPGKIWQLAQPGSADCKSSYSYGTVSTYPATGAAAFVATPLFAGLNPIGC